MARLQARRRQIGSLETLHIEGSEDGPWVVIFHGFGADMSDLAPLAGALGLPETTNWIFPNGHLSVPLGGHYEGRAWFPISIAELERSMTTGAAIDWSQMVPPGLKDARERAQEMIDELDVPPERLVLAGFSQGGMLATDLVLNMQKPPAGLAILSGTLINADEWSKLARLKTGFNFFQSHGVRDPVLKLDMAVRLEQLLLEAGWKGQLARFGGGHEIPADVLAQLGGYIRRRLK